MHHCAQQARIALDAHGVLNFYLDLALRLTLAAFALNALRHRRQVNVADLQRTARQLGQRQQAINQLAHLPRAGANPVQVVRDFVARIVAGYGLVADRARQQVTETVDGIERRTQVVRHGIGKSL